MGDGISLQTKRGLMELERSMGQPMVQPAAQPYGVTGLSNRPIGAPAAMPQYPGTAKDTFQQLFRHYKAMGADDATARRQALDVLMRMGGPR